MTTGHDERQQKRPYRVHRKLSGPTIGSMGTRCSYETWAEAKRVAIREFDIPLSPGQTLEVTVSLSLPVREPGHEQR